MEKRDPRLSNTRVRVNERIRASEIRLIDEDGSQLGIMTPDRAIQMARAKELDLVEIAPQANPPVCRILNFGKYLYQQDKKAQEARRHQRQTQLKEIKFRPKTDEHDYQFKKNHIARFLDSGHMVKATVMYRGREIHHVDVGRRILDRLLGELGDFCSVERTPKLEGRNLSMILTPKRQHGREPARSGAAAGS
ncbi:MAG TPA: translation initiation factor IF-3 [Acidobacteriota bacterium]